MTTATAPSRVTFTATVTLLHGGWKFAASLYRSRLTGVARAARRCPAPADECAGQLETGYYGSMEDPEDAPQAAVDRRGPSRSWFATLAAAALVVLPLAAGCGDEPAATTSSTPGARTATPAVTAGGGLGPPKFQGGVCERTTADEKSLPSLARVTVERFIAAADKGDRTTMRALFDPLGADEVLAHLRPVTRLGLLALEDRY